MSLSMGASSSLWAARTATGRTHCRVGARVQGAGEGMHMSCGAPQALGIPRELYAVGAHKTPWCWLPGCFGVQRSPRPELLELVPCCPIPKA